MKLEDQVVGLELSTRLKELGVKQESYFYHVKYDINDYKIEHLARAWDNTCSAFTVAELGAMLPYNIDYKNTFWHLKVYKLPSYFRVTYFADEGGLLNTFIDSNEADARAKMLIYFLENNLIKLAEVNE